MPACDITVRMRLVIDSGDVRAHAFAVAQREVTRTRIAAKRALAHLDEVLSFGQPDTLRPLRRFTHRNAEAAVRNYRAAIDKRTVAFRQLS